MRRQFWSFYYFLERTKARKINLHFNVSFTNHLPVQQLSHAPPHCLEHRVILKNEFSMKLRKPSIVFMKLKNSETLNLKIYGIFRLKTNHFQKCFPLCKAVFFEFSLPCPISDQSLTFVYPFSTWLNLSSTIEDRK